MQRLLDDASKISGIKYDISSFADITDAIHVMQEEMGIAGATALEAGTTIEGSANAMKSAWSNLITGIADDNADFGTLMSNMVNSVGTFAENLLPRIEIALGGIANLISQLAPIIIEKLPELFSQILPELLNGAVSLVQSLAGVLPSLISTLVSSITSALPTVINALVDALFVLQSSLIDALPSVIQSVVAALPSTLQTLINGSVKLFTHLVENFDKIINPIIKALPDVIIALVTALTKNLPSLIDGLIELTLSLVEAIPEIISGIVDSIPTIVSLLIQATFEAIPQIIAGLVQVVWQIVLALPQICYELVKGFINIFVGAWDGIKKVFSFESVGKFFSSVWSGIKNAFGSVVNFFGNIFSGAWKAIKNAFSGVGKFFGGIWDKIVGTFKTVGTKVANAIGGAFKSAINAVIATIEGALNLIPKAINGAIGLINKLPGVEISKIPLINLPRLERGGVLKRGQIGLLEGNGAEAVVPLERHTGWINRIAEQLDEKMQYKQSNAQGYSRQSVEFKVGIDDKANAMGLARALLPLLKVAEKEMYV